MADGQFFGMEPEHLKDVAKCYTTYRDTIVQCLEELESQVNNMHWEGESYESFRNDFEDLKKTTRQQYIDGVIQSRIDVLNAQADDVLELSRSINNAWS